MTAWLFASEYCIRWMHRNGEADAAETTNQSNKVPFNEAKNCSRPNPDFIRNFFLITYKQSLLF